MSGVRMLRLPESTLDHDHAAHTWELHSEALAADNYLIGKALGLIPYTHTPPAPTPRADTKRAIVRKWVR